jgi:hypothetical protein
MPRPATDPLSPKAIVRASETDRLRRYLGIRGSVDAALQSGRVQRSKVAEAWLFHPIDVTGESLLEAAERSADDLLIEWLLLKLPVIAGMLSRTVEPPSSKKAVQAMLHALLRSRRLLGIGLLTARGEPYVATHRIEDRAEIGRQVAITHELLGRGLPVSIGDLPPPDRHVPRRAWAELVLGHAEFRGWGRLTAEGILEPWRTPK